MSANAEVLYRVIAQGDRPAAALPLARARAEWREALQQAVLHQCVPMFRDRLVRFGMIDDVPPDVRERLLELTRETAVKNFKGILQIKTLLAALDPGISLIALKGASLAATCYSAPSLRPMHDLDLLARTADLATVRSALLGLGYTQDPRLRPSVCTHHDVPYLGDGLPVELHWSLLDADAPFPIDYEGLWARAVPSASLARLYYLSPEDELLHVCLHAGYHHQFDVGLYAFIDLAMLSREFRVDWRVVIERAQAWKAQRCVYLTLVLATVLAAAPVPAAVLEELRPADFSEKLLERAAVAVYHKRRVGYQPADFVANLLVQLIVCGQWRTMLPKIRRRLLSKPELRSPWPGPDSSVTWQAQLAPIWRGVWGFATSRQDRAQLRARWSGARLQRWMR